MDTNDIDAVVQLLCKQGARSLTRYARVTDLDINFMPETFIQSYILDHMGDDVTVVLETHFNELVKWSLETKNERKAPVSAKRITDAIQAVDMGTKKIDLVLFKNPHLPKPQQDILALVEVKNQRISAEGEDRDKLIEVLRHIDSCPYGIVCGWTANPDDYKRHAEVAGDKWFQKECTVHDETIFFCARLFEPSRR